MEERNPTHTLTITVPLDLSHAEMLAYDPVHTALNVIMHATRLAVDGVLCGNVDVSIQETPT